jgi:riboflavin transporter FmnP
LLPSALANLKEVFVMKKISLATLIKISVLSGMAFILMLLEFPLPIFPSFLKIDFSDIPALLGAFALGPIPGIIIELLKNILNVLIRGSQTAMIGEAANFIVGSALVGTAGVLYKRSKTRKNALISVTAGVLVMTLIASVTNYYIWLPLYESALHFPIEAMVAAGQKIFKGITDLNSFVAYSIVPFNLFKGVVVALITVLVYKKLSPILHKK